jgi:ribosomal silencing factor RsfS
MMSYLRSQNKRLMDCFATLAITDNVVIANTKATNHRHYEERSDEAIHNKTSLLDCFATLANVSSTESMTDNVVIADTKATNHRHCEERSDETIHFA